MTTKEKPSEGWQCDRLDAETRPLAIEAALDYRGDVTVLTVEGKEITGYLFNRRGQGDEQVVEFFVAGQDDPVAIRTETIRSVVLSGRDPAAGKSWDAWMDKVREAEARGEIAELYPEDTAA